MFFADLDNLVSSWALCRDIQVEKRWPSSSSRLAKLFFPRYRPVLIGGRITFFLIWIFFWLWIFPFGVIPIHRLCLVFLCISSRAILPASIIMAANTETAIEPHKTFDTILVLDFGSVKGNVL